MIGQVKDRYRTSKYGNAGLPPIQGDMHAMFIVLADRFTEAAMTMRRAEQSLARGDAAAAEEFGAAATAFARCGSVMQSLPDALTNFVNNEITEIAGGGATGYYYGTAQVSFGGGTDEHNTCTITSGSNVANMEWVNSNSIWFGTVEMATSSGPTYHFFQCSMGGFDPTPASYIEIIVYCPTAPVAGDYDVRWVAFPNG
jgi:hypothetical protein